MSTDDDNTDGHLLLDEVVSIEKTWSTNIERILDKLRITCTQLSQYHRFKYQYCKGQVKWFRIPIIVLSGINTFTSVGLQEHVDQRYISIVSSCISLMCGIITGIEMFMKYQDKMETELTTHKEYYKLSVDIYKMLSIDRCLRKKTGKDFIDEIFNEYEKIKSRSRPEQHSNLVYDMLADNDELILYKRNSSKNHKKGWINKIEMPPPLYEKHNSHYFSDVITYDRFRNPEKYALREQSKYLENKTKITQKYIDKRWLEKMERQHIDEPNDPSNEKVIPSPPPLCKLDDNDSDNEFIPSAKKGYFTQMSNLLFRDPQMNICLSDDDEIENTKHNEP